MVSWVTVALSSLSDVMPPKWRAPSFGLLFSGFSLGFISSTGLALMLSHLGVSVLALSLLTFGLLFAVCCLPETLPREVSREAKLRQRRLRAQNEEIDAEADADGSGGAWRRGPASRILIRPFAELSILNRDRTFRLLSTLAFFSGMSGSADQSLLVYYAEEWLAFDDSDVAVLFVIWGVLGIVIQGAVLKPLNDCIGERRVIVVAFLFGVLNNVMIGLATTKGVLFAAIAVGVFTSMSFPTISAIKSCNVVSDFSGIQWSNIFLSMTSDLSSLLPWTARAVLMDLMFLPLPTNNNE